MEISSCSIAQVCYVKQRHGNREDRWTEPKVRLWDIYIKKEKRRDKTEVVGSHHLIEMHDHSAIVHDSLFLGTV